MREVIIVPKGNPAGITGLKDLATKPVKLVVGVDNVPIGKYTRQVFENANEGYGPNFSQNVLSQVVSTETNVREVDQKVATGEAQAGIVYQTYGTAGIADEMEVVEIPGEYVVTAENYAAVPNDAPYPGRHRNSST